MMSAAVEAAWREHIRAVDIRVLFYEIFYINLHMLATAGEPAVREIRLRIGGDVGGISLEADREVREAVYR